MRERDREVRKRGSKGGREPRRQGVRELGSEGARGGERELRSEERYLTRHI